MIWGRDCTHERVRCIHGDEILSTIRAFRTPMLARARCLDCGRALYDRALPRACWYTNTPHSSANE